MRYRYRYGDVYNYAHCAAAYSQGGGASSASSCRLKIGLGHRSEQNVHCIATLGVMEVKRDSFSDIANYLSHGTYPAGADEATKSSLYTQAVQV